MTSGMALPAAAALFRPSPRSVPGIPASPGGGRAIIGHEMSGTDRRSCRRGGSPPALPDRASRKPAPEKDPCGSRTCWCVVCARACRESSVRRSRAWGEGLRPGRSRPMSGRLDFWTRSACVLRGSPDGRPSRPRPRPRRRLDPPSPDIVPTAGSPCESIVTSGFSSFPLPLTSSESDVSRDEFPSPVTPLRSSSRSPLAVLGLHGSSESRRRPSHTPPCASSSACAARAPWSLEPEPPPSRRRDAPRDFVPAPLSAPSPAVALRFPSGGGGRGLAAVALGVALTAQFRAALGPRHAGHQSLSRCPRGRVACSGAPSSSEPVLLVNDFRRLAGEKFGPVVSAVSK